MDYPDQANNYLEQHATIIADSYRRLLGADLLSPAQDSEPFARRLFHAPFAVVSHNIDPDPVFNYANLAALELFEFSWEEFTRLPSRLSAEPVNQAERDRLLAEVTEKGYISDYQGVRISKSGRRFLIKNAIVWNLSDSDRCYYGQAACFKGWRFL